MNTEHPALIRTLRLVFFVAALVFAAMGEWVRRDSVGLPGVHFCIWAFALFCLITAIRLKP